MLPTSGYFRGVSCPDYEKGRCLRPYCHFHHYPRRDTNPGDLQGLASELENADGNALANDTSEPKAATAASITEDQPMCSKSDNSSSKNESTGGVSEEATESSSNNQSELLQQLVADAVKKALSENPLLAAAGVDPTSLMKNIDTTALVAQASAEINQTKTKKKYLRPPDTPSYNPTPIEELNKRKRSVDSSDKEGGEPKVMKYVPSTVSSSSVISDVLEGEITKSSVDSEVTDFSSDDNEEADKRRDDFDILEEVLAEHSQNNKTVVKKKKKRMLGKLQINLNTPEKNINTSSVISDAQCSDVDSNSCDTSKKKISETQNMGECSYFLPPSPVFTSSSDGFGMFDSTVYTTSNSDNGNNNANENVPAHEKETSEKVKNNTDKINEQHKSNGGSISEGKVEARKEVLKSKNKGHSMLPQLVQTINAPKISRRNIRSWTPHNRSIASKGAGDPLDEILQLLDGEDSQKNEESRESGQKQSQQKVEPSSSIRTYKVDLDKEIQSLSNLASNKRDETVLPPPDSSEEKNENNCPTSLDQSTKKSESGEISKEEKMNQESDKLVETKDSKSKQEEKNIESESKDTDKDSEEDEDDDDDDDRKSRLRKASDEDLTSKDDESCESDTKRDRRRRKRKRDRSSSSDSEHSYHRKKRKKSHKRHRKNSRNKKKRKRRNSRDDSDENEHSEKDEDSENDKSDDQQDDDTIRIKKHKKHKKRGRHHKKYKYKRRRSKSKRKRNRSHSSSDSSSDSTSSRSRSRSRSRSESSERSRSRSQSPGKRKNKDRQKTCSRESEDKLKGRNSSDEEQEITKDQSQVLSVPMPVDPSKIKCEKGIVPDLSIVKTEKDVDPLPNISSKKDETRHTEKKNLNDINIKKERSSHAQLSCETSSKENETRIHKEQSKSRQDRKSSTDSMSDKSSSFRRQSTDSKKSESEVTSGSSKTELKRRASVDTAKKDNITQDSQCKVLSMFDLVIASTQQAQQPKVLKEVSLFDTSAGNGNVSDEDSAIDDVDCAEPLITENVVTKKEDSHKSKSSHHSRGHSNSRNHKDDKSESKKKHSSSSSKDKNNSHKSSSSHQSSSSNKHRRDSSSNKHSSTTVSSSTSSTKETHSSKTKEKSSETSSSHSSGSSKHHSSKHSSSSKSQKSSSSSSTSSTSSRKHSGSHNKVKEHSSSSKGDGKRKENSGNKKYSTGNAAANGLFDKELSNEGGDSPLPDLSALDEIPQDDWEEMMNTEKYDLQHLENLEDDDEFGLDDLDKDDPEVMEECMRMFNEYRPEDSQPQTSSKKPKVASKESKEEPDTYIGKKRIARSSTGNMIVKKLEHKTHKMTPAQVMMERYKKMKEEHMELMKQLEKQKQQLEEQSRAASSSALSSTTSSKHSTFPASSTSLKSPPMSTPGGPKRRISHVPNVSSLLHAREKIKNLMPTNSKNLLSPRVAKASGALPHTTAHTVAKGGKRTAHMPKSETLARPTIPAEFGSKVPQNIRQRYLNSFIDECLKFAGKRTAFRTAMAEERVCYNRAASRMVYLNLAVNTLKRLRTQQVIGEAAQELIDNDPQFGECSDSEEPSTSTKSSSAITPSPSKTISHHPLNPNHVRQSHFSVLAGGGQKGSWSIEKPKKNTADVSNCLKGSNFYKLLKKYVLTEEQLQSNGYPIPDPEEKGKAIIVVRDTRKKLSPSPQERYCDRCALLYKVDKWGFPTTTGPCVYHWGRAYKRRGPSGFETRYSCCGGDSESDGCVQATTHVSQNYNPNDLRGYVRTLPKESSNGDYGVYALDCEMCYTTAGNELTRLTVIDTEGNSVYEQLVKPENPIIDYNTRFSGITEDDMKDVKTTIFDVQAALLTRFSDKTILIGHSLESDFQALKLIHDTVVDTSVVFPHKMGPPYKRALRNLASEILKKIIQNDVSGHDSAEDAVTCMRLMQWKIKEDFKGIKK